MSEFAAHNDRGMGHAHGLSFKCMSFRLCRKTTCSVERGKGFNRYVGLTTDDHVTLILHCWGLWPGRSRMRLRRTGEVFSLVPPNSKAHNLIVGRIWVDCYGDFKLLNVTTGAKCALYFQPCGWFGAGRYEVGAPGRSRTLVGVVFVLVSCLVSLIWLDRRNGLLVLTQ